MFIILFLIIFSHRNICIKDQYTFIKIPHMTIYIYIYIYGDMRYNQIFLTDSRINISSHNKNFITAIYRRNLRNRLWSSLLPSSPLLYLYFIFSKNFFKRCHNKLEFLQCTSVIRCHGGQRGGGDVLKTSLGPTLTADQLIAFPGRF